MPALTTCDCIGSFPPNEVQWQIFCVLQQILVASGGGTGSDQYTSTVDTATVDGSIPAGVLGWSITNVSGTVTVNGEALAVGGSYRGGGYGGRVSTAAISYTVSGSALVAYDTPA